MIKRTLYHFHFCCGLGGGELRSLLEVSEVQIS